MPDVSLQCPLCSGVLQVDTVWAGQQVACPLCQGLLTLPPAEVLDELTAGASDPPLAPPPLPTEPVAPPANSDGVMLACPTCSGAFQVSLALAGQQVGCPHCGAPVVIPALASVEQTPSLAPPRTYAPTDEYRAANGLADEAISPEPAATTVYETAQPAEATPPGAQLPPFAAPEQPRLPNRPQPLPVPVQANLTADTAAPGGIGMAPLREQPQVVGEGTREVELRRLTPEEKARRRFRRNLALSVVCLAILMIVTYVMTR